MADIIENVGTYPNGRADVIVPKVINAAWNKGLELKTEYATKVNNATTGFLDTINAPHVGAGSVTVPTIDEPNVSIPATIDTSEILNTYDTKYLELVQLLSDKFTAFRTSFFPDEGAAYVAAEDWLQAALTNPESGLPQTVQDQIFGDDQARILGDKVRAQDAVVAQFAARRFPLPPDVAANAVLQIEQKAQDELAESSRKVAMMSVEMQKFSVEKMLGLRGMAMDSAIKYITALASGPDMASRVIGIGYDAQSKLISAASAFYNARTQAKETIAKVAQYNNSTALEAAVKNQAADLSLIEDKMKALLAEAQSLAQMATALLNNVHASAGISQSTGNSVTYSASGEASGTPAWPGWA